MFVASLHGDPHDLQRFVDAQERDYASALAEIAGGAKRSHWMWYVFPQFEGLGLSAMSRRYAIRSRAEAEAYLEHLVLGPRLHQCAGAVLAVPQRSAHEIFGSPDDLKLHACATLFAAVSADDSVFHRLLDKFWRGMPHEQTLALLGTSLRRP
jgi:uncharacterized protein (DUF1810 family)